MSLRLAMILFFRGFYTKFEEYESDSRLNPYFPDFLINNDETEIKSNGYQLETQYLCKTTRIHWITGLGYTNLSTDRDVITKIRFIDDPETDLGLDTVIADDTDMPSRQFNGYMYSLVELQKNLTSVFGFSLDAF